MSNIAKAFLWLAGLILLIELCIYALAPLYDFPEPLPFHGDSIYNPYKGIPGGAWQKANFHYHSRAWMGLTSGSENSYGEFYETYRMLGYTAPQISNYQQIDSHYRDSSFYIPTYEHGFGIRKKHQILIGAHEVLWLDYSLVQTLNHKQHILDRLRAENDIVAIAHPDWEKGYTTDDMRYLTNYDLIEVLDNNWRSFIQWDEALSNGHVAYILADDDAHNIRDPFEVGMCCTYIHSHVVSREALVDALRSGKAYGADLDINYGDTFETKARESGKLPQLSGVEVRHDTLFVEVDGPAFKITFIGQHGAIRKIERFTNKAWYKLMPEDTYIRTAIRFFNYKRQPGTTLYLNPVFRTVDGKLPTPQLATVNTSKTWVFRILAFAGIALILAALSVRKK